MSRTIFVYRRTQDEKLCRGEQNEKLCVESLKQGDIIRIYNLNSHDYREYYIACDSWSNRYIVSDKFNIHNFDLFIETLPYLNRIIEDVTEV